ncbi:hypothetical protein ACS0TY_021592 [Phlomoides rotata]
MDEPSLLSDSAANQLGQVSDLGNSSLFPAKNPMHNGSKFRGVVSQPNGNWGAQIYADHQRIWLGTFKSENEAAMAYDRAAIKLRKGITNRNFPWTDVTVREPSFQGQFNTETVLAMIKDGSYGAKFADFLKVQDRQGYQITTLRVNSRLLFQKRLTPSDVGKLNRLVIPKKYAVKFFPKIVDVNEKNRSSMQDVDLVFYDRSMRSWNFRYRYWHSSQSFVFTRGWNRFTKEKGLRSKDRVIFSCYDQEMFIIDVKYAVRARVIEEALQITDSDDQEIGSEGPRVPNETLCAFPCNEPKKVVRLFGVHIC